METFANSAEENERIFQEASIQASYTCQMPMEIIKVFNSVIATLGNFSLSTGKTKAKKTFNLSAV
ncbi:MAG: mobilization protein, partial [Bacteroidaceae bacterium]